MRVGTRQSGAVVGPFLDLSTSLGSAGSRLGRRQGALVSTPGPGGRSATQRPIGVAAACVRSNARRAPLARRAKGASAGERALLRRGAYEVVWSIVFDGLTRRIERQRGHRRCSLGIQYLEPDCLDRFQDDVEAVVDDLLRYGSVPI